MKAVTLLPPDTTARGYQPEHCGPYLERSFDSAPDPSFHPDAWQRKAGKIFVSFYAMKKVLQATTTTSWSTWFRLLKHWSIRSRPKSSCASPRKYAQEGKFVWAIHTRDYRIHNVKGYQILVTVPQMLLQILTPRAGQCQGTAQLLAGAFKRIVFNEHVVWEQLLLLGLCPIIATRSQKVKGFVFEMIVHSSRSSDGRTCGSFIYNPVPSVLEFTGLAPVERLPFPGLDSELRTEKH
ncbi:uncharacterized protein B0T15DRAFT_486360 [Chaetomium strumarium]|uniref:Uncharacterized protein n=1 Tax=Chaetomium strumarium TaxID=1170767 RepID=A0AAJ0GS51_9PEZI|nr:hypothetical protein B0T15DRAFT_486360 [Chaetomium strumarium]